MNYSDIQTANAVKTRTPMKLNQREVTVPDGHTVRVSLHGTPCLSVDHHACQIEIDGATPATRKSTRLINTVLEAFGPFRVFTRKGQWWVLNPGGGRLEFTGKLATIPMNI